MDISRHLDDTVILAAGGRGGSVDEFLTDVPSQTISLEGNDERSSHMVYGRDVKVVVTDNGLTTRGSSKVKINPIVNYDWEHKYYVGNLVAVHLNRTYVAYVLKNKSGGVVRILNLHTAERVLLSGVTETKIVDISFAYMSRVIIGVTDQLGCLYVHEVTEDNAGKLHSKVKFQCIRPTGGVRSDYHRLIWCLYVPEDDDNEVDVITYQDDEEFLMCLLTHDQTAEVWNVAHLIQLYGSEAVHHETVKSGLHSISYHSKPIVDAAFSPDGCAVATASLDGCVKFFEIKLSEDAPPVFMHNLVPHDGKPLSCLFFLDNHKHPNSGDKFWRYAVTGANSNSELKIWNCETWTCMQTLTFTPPPTSPLISPSPSLCVLKHCIDLSSTYLILSDIHKSVMYILQFQQSGNQARVCYLSEFLLTQSYFSLAVLNAGRHKLNKSAEQHWTQNTDESVAEPEEHDEVEVDESSEGPGVTVVVKLFAIQTRALQEMQIRYLPPSPGRYPPSSVSCLSHTSPVVSLQDLMSDLSLTPDRPAADKQQIHSHANNHTQAGKETDKQREKNTSADKQTDFTILAVQPTEDELVQEPSLLNENPVAGAVLIRAGVESPASSLTEVTALDQPDEPVSSVAQDGAGPPIYNLQPTTTSSRTSENLMENVEENLIEDSMGADGKESSHIHHEVSWSNSSSESTSQEVTEILENVERSGEGFMPELDDTYVADDNDDINDDDEDIVDKDDDAGMIKSKDDDDDDDEDDDDDDGDDDDNEGDNADDEDDIDDDVKIEDDEVNKFIDDILCETNDVCDKNDLISDEQVKGDEEVIIEEIKEEDDESSMDDVINESTVRSLVTGNDTKQTNQEQEQAERTESLLASTPRLQSTDFISSPAALKPSSRTEDAALTEETKDVVKVDLHVKAEQIKNSEAQKNKNGEDVKDRISDKNVIKSVGVKPSPSGQSNLQARNSDAQSQLMLREIVGLLRSQQKEVTSLRQEVERLREQRSRVEGNVTSHYTGLSAEVERTNEQMEKMKLNQKKLMSNMVEEFQLKSVERQKNLIDVINAKIEKEVRSQLKVVIKEAISTTVSPHIAQILESLREKFHAELSKKLTTTDVLVKENITKMSKSKQFNDTLTQIVGSKFQESLQTVCHNSFLPLFNEHCRNLVQTFGATMNSGVSQCQQKWKEADVKRDGQLDKITKQLQTVIDSVKSERDSQSKTAEQLKSVVVSLKTLSSSTSEETSQQKSARIENMMQSQLEKLSKDLIDKVKVIVSEELAGRLGEQQVTISEQLHQAIQRSRAASPLPLTAADQRAAHQRHILSLLESNQISAAFEKALTVQDTAVVDFVCKQVEPYNVLGVKPCPLTQGTILSLIHHLGNSISQDTELKLSYLEEAVSALDENSAVTRSNLGRVLPLLTQELNSYIQSADRQDSFVRPMTRLVKFCDVLLKSVAGPNKR